MVEEVRKDDAKRDRQEVHRKQNSEMDFNREKLVQADEEGGNSSPKRERKTRR